MPNNITVQQSLSSLPDPLVQPVYLGYSGEQPWSTRRIKVAQHLLAESPVLSGFEEALVRQVDDLQELLGDEWSWIGVGRDDGVAAGEFNPIFYKNSAITLISNDTFWLSNTPFVPSGFPGAGSFRICTAARFELKTSPSGQPVRFSHLETHLDDQSDAQRRLGASMLLYRARYEAFTTKSPVILTGDFNSESTGNTSGAYQIVTGVIPPVAINETFAQKYAVPNGALPGFVLQDLKGRRRASPSLATTRRTPGSTARATRRFSRGLISCLAGAMGSGPRMLIELGRR
ncbi:hypothetical protein A0H81_03050 [Grifola frondosa]|uniref:Uncharacterized protein n=1 Tax=Grifola frondosa TaxID=5627 RepID=A0A1C7MJ17_GRIFR|nr:hypothetical protein A0H81_03050 [Grifola frondosa]